MIAPRRNTADLRYIAEWCMWDNPDAPAYDEARELTFERAKRRAETEAKERGIEWAAVRIERKGRHVWETIERWSMLSFGGHWEDIT